MAPLDKMMTGVHVLDYSDTTIEISEPKKKRRRKQQVSFSKYSEIYEVPNKSEMSLEEFEATYMTGKDYHRIKKDIGGVIRLIVKTGQYPEETSECYHRGLEIHIPSFRKIRKQKMAIMMEVVLIEQEEFGHLRQEWVERSLCSLTSKFVTDALNKGYYDAQSVVADLMRERRELLNTQLNKTTQR